jgi:hypothetical protein
MLCRRVAQRLLFRPQKFGKISETFPHGSRSDLPGDLGKFLEVMFSIAAIGIHDLYQMPNTTAEFWMSQAIYNGPLQVRDWHTFATPPRLDRAGNPCAGDPKDTELMVK